MVSVSVTYENLPQVRARLANLANAAKVIGASKSKVGSEGVDYAGYVIHGTRPHDIYPRDKKALFWPGAAHPVGVVHHPGTKPNPFLERAMTKSRAAAEAHVAHQLEQVASGGGSNYGQIMPGAAKIVLKAAKEEAPVGKTGNLRKSLYSV